MHFVLSLALKIDSACVPKNDKNGVLVLALSFTEVTTQIVYEIAIEVLPDEVDVLELLGQTSPPTVHPFPLTLPTGWARWTLDVNGLGTSKTFDLTVGSTAIFKKEVLQRPLFLLQHPQLVIGALVKNTSGQAPACKVRADDILFDVRTTAAAN
jgi:hypothetical protein